MIQTAVHLAAAALICFLTGQTAPPVFIAALLLALAPDLDTPKSLIGSLVAPLSQRIERAVGHRTATHSLAALTLVGGAAYVIAPASWGVLAGSYASHLAIDLIIGVQGILLFWPASDEWFTLAAWRDDGPAPRALLVVFLVAIIGVVLWPVMSPALSPQVMAAVKPIATPKPATPIASPRPAIKISFELPAGVNMSALWVKVGDRLAEGQIVAAWERPAAMPWPTPTIPALPPTPAAIPVHLTDSSASRGVSEAEDALNALTTAQAAERSAMIAEQQRQTADAQRKLAEARRDLDALQPRHEREQQERRHAVDQARQALDDAQAAAALVDQGDPAAVQRAAERVHKEQAALRSALDAQDRMRTDQGLERQQAEAAVTQAQADLDALLGQQPTSLAKLDGQHASALILSRSRLESARSSAGDVVRQVEHDQALAAVTATAVAVAWQAQTTATAQAHAAAATATAAAIPTPAPNQVISRASGQVSGITAEERAGVLIVTLELVP